MKHTKLRISKCLSGWMFTGEAHVVQSADMVLCCHEKNPVCVHHISPVTYYCIILMRCVCVSRGDNPVSRLQSPSETSLSHFIHFDPVLGNSLISHNAVDQWFPFSADVISGFKPVLCSYLTLFLRGLECNISEKSMSAHTEGNMSKWAHTGMCFVVVSLILLWLFFLFFTVAAV